MTSCDLCGSPDFVPIAVAENYMTQDPPVICRSCGFVYVRERRSSKEIAEDWKRIYEDKIYDPNWPGVRARLFYVAEWIDQNIGLLDKSLLDIGGGTGTFEAFVREAGANTSSLEPAFGGPTIEEYEPTEFDIVTILWTLENCGDCNAMISKARECLKPDGHLIVATGSRICVPFRKPMRMYFSDQPQDLHCFRWSVSSLGQILAKHGFSHLRMNDYQQNDVLLVCGSPSEPSEPLWSPRVCDTVQKHFIDWWRMFP